MNKNDMEQRYFLHPLEEASLDGFAISKRNVGKMGKLDTSIHFHDYFELEIITDGTAIHYLNGAPIPIKRGYISLLTPKDFHTFHIEENVLLRLYNIAFTANHVSPDLIKTILDFPHAIHGTLDDVTAASLFEICELLYRERQHPTSSFPMIQRSLLDSMISLLFDRFSNTKDVQTRQPKTINDTLLYIEKNFTDPTISLSQIANKLNRTQNHLGKIIREYTGLPFNQYINQKRLNHAQSLLRVSAIPIQKIAADSGFSSTSYFIKLFKEEYNMTPSEYRQALLKS